MTIKQFNNLTFKRGFTLIELLVVISIIAILVGAGIYTWSNAQAKARDHKRKEDLKEVQKALEIYYQLTGRYPEGDVTGQIGCATPYTVATVGWGSAFECTDSANKTDDFMKKLPKDPVFDNAPGNESGYYYQPEATFQTYTLSAKLENSNDPDLPPKSTLPCSPQGLRNWCLVNP